MVMHKVGIIALVSGIALVGCSVENLQGEASGPAVISGGAPSPSPEQEERLLEELGKINPELNHEMSVGHARNVCADILRPDGAKMDTIERARQNFSRDIDGPITSTIAEQIVRVIESNGFCV